MKSGESQKDTHIEHQEDESILEGRTTGIIIRCFYRVYDYLGYGFLEAVYCEALAIEFEEERLSFLRDPNIDVFYKNGRRLGKYKPDFLVDGKVIVEVKATEFLTYSHQRQLRNAIRVSIKEVGLLLHFGPKARFERLVHTNSRKPHAKMVLSA